MRQKRSTQSSIFEVYAEHELGRELKTMSVWLDAHPQLLDAVVRDLCRHGVKATGREGLSAESALRCALLKQYRQLSYQELAFHLLDSASFQAFARLALHWSPKKSVLQRAVSAISETTWAQINRVLLLDAKAKRVERGQCIRVDSTVTEAPVHEPTDSSLLCDSVRVMVRLLQQAKELLAPVHYHNHMRVAKKRGRAILYARTQVQRTQRYRELLVVAEATLSYLDKAAVQLSASCEVDALGVELWLSQVKHYRPLIQGVISQTQRRVIHAESVPASEKVLSLFEPHTDLIRKGHRKVQYGHKLNLTSGRSGLIFDVVIERGNPADAERFVPMLERHIHAYGAAPRQVAADGGFASTENLRWAKAHGVEDMAFHKKCGLTIEDMVKSRWVYRRLRNFRAGIEANISCLKRAYGLSRCTWKGLKHFNSYVWSSVVAYNLALFARFKPT